MSLGMLSFFLSLVTLKLICHNAQIIKVIIILDNNILIRGKNGLL